MVRFSDLALAYGAPTNRLYRLQEQRRRQGRPTIDLVSGNVSTQGIRFPPALLEAALKKGLRRASDYHPDPLGQRAAREAVSRYYRREGLSIPAQQIVMTPGTSLAYWYAFKLLGNTGDEFLSPQPSYPLFDHIAGLAGVVMRPYQLRESGRWRIDFEDLESQITPRTKAIILISPHNPTGAVATAEEVQYLGRLASEKNLAVIADEVFAPFLFHASTLARPADTNAPLVLTFNGLSKMLALPGLKVAWMAVTGRPAAVRTAMHTLETMSDTFLPVQEAVQLALPELLEKSVGFLRDYQNEIRRRCETAVKCIVQAPAFSFAPPEGGFFLTLRLQDHRLQEEAFVCRLLKEEGILAHPGYFYDMPGHHAVISFASRPARLRKALRAMITRASLATSRPGR